MNVLPTPARLVDAHVGGVLTRIVVSGGPALAGTSMTERLATFNAGHDAWRGALTGAPRSAPGTQAALLTEPERPGSLVGVLFLAATGPVAPTPDGLVAVLAALAHVGRLRPGPVRLDTPEGTIAASFALDGSVRFDDPALQAPEGRGHILFDGTLVAEPDDPLAWGAPAAASPGAAAVGGD
ncbi:proline racemase family protein [Roseateles sp.]|uniref:proline racemase family protein n=1 Tax=Roseateles sp. TaxID=1971397 RepID=UPI0031D17BA7